MAQDIDRHELIITTAEWIEPFRETPKEIRSNDVSRSSSFTDD